MKNHWAMHDGDGLRTFDTKKSAEQDAEAHAKAHPGETFIVYESVCAYRSDIALPRRIEGAKTGKDIAR